MNGKEIPFNKSDKYIEIIHKSTFLYLIVNCSRRKSHSTSNLQEERTRAQESKMGNVHGHHHHGHHSVGQAPVGHPSGHHSVGQAAGPAETEVAFNNYMERVIGKTFIILSIFTSIRP